MTPSARCRPARTWPGRLVVLGLALTAWAGGLVPALTASAAPAQSLTERHPVPVDDTLEYAVLRDGRSLYWQVSRQTGAGAPAPLPGTLETPLGSVWKLFVHAYLTDRAMEPPDYVCGGRDPDEVYCCAPGASIGREAALTRSCGLYFSPTRLALTPADWSRYWQARGAPVWLTRLDALQPDTRVPVESLLRALDSVPETARRQAGGALLASVLAARDPDLARHFGGLLRAKTYSWHQPGRPDARLGGAAGWLADGSPVWLSGRGTSQTVLSRAASRFPAALAEPGRTSDAGAGGCVRVALFQRYPLASVVDATGRPARPGPLRGRHQARFANGNTLDFQADGETALLPGSPPRLESRLSLNEYVARVLDREAAPEPAAAARALAVVVRSYVLQEARREGDCLVIADSSATQRVAPGPASAAARRVAHWTDSLILDAPVQYHLDQPAPQRLAWTQAVQWARAGAGFDDILRRVWPGASLASSDSPLATDCRRLPEAERWLARQVPRWQRRLAREDGFEPAPVPAVCRVAQGNPRADLERGRIHAHGLAGREDRLTLAHEYLHLAFAQHPKGRDEGYIEGLARRLLMEDTP